MCFTYWSAAATGQAPRESMPTHQPGQAENPSRPAASASDDEEPAPLLGRATDRTPTCRALAVRARRKAPVGRQPLADRRWPRAAASTRGAAVGARCHCRFRLRPSAARSHNRRRRCVIVGARRAPGTSAIGVSARSSASAVPRGKGGPAGDARVSRHARAGTAKRSDVLRTALRPGVAATQAARACPAHPPDATPPRTAGRQSETPPAPSSSPDAQSGEVRTAQSARCSSPSSSSDRQHIRRPISQRPRRSASQGTRDEPYTLPKRPLLDRPAVPRADCGRPDRREVPRRQQRNDPHPTPRAASAGTSPSGPRHPPVRRYPIRIGARNWSST